jgi:type IV secretion system protein VirB6
MTVGAPVSAMCPATPGQGLVTQLVDSVDCHIQVMVHDSYRALVGPDTWFSNAFTVLLTVYIALMGYQLLLGRNGLRLTDLPVSALKIGLILAFLTSWAAYQTVVYDLLFEGPRQILATLMQPVAARGGVAADVYLGLEQAYASLAAGASFYGSMASPSANILQGGPMLGSGMLWLSAIIMLLSTVGLILAAKIVLGFLLAIGPIFIGLFLFDSTRGFFDGWLRTTLAFALAPLAASVFGMAMLVMLRPFLVSLDEQVRQGTFDMGSVMTITLIVLVFLIVMLQVLRIGASIAGGFSTSGAGPGRRGAATGSVSAPAAASISVESERGGEGRAAQATLLRAAADMQGRGADISVALDDRRGRATADALAPMVAPSERLGQAARRMPRPTRRPGEATP